MVSLLTVDGVCEVAGLDAQTLRNWVAAKVVEPAVSLGEGRGNGHRFTVPQAVGLCVAAHLRRTERGCALSYVRDVVQAFAAMPEGELIAQLGEGHTHFIMVHHRRPLLRGRQYDWPDVRAAYSAVTALARELARPA